jgi:hypothetical protein
MGLNKMRLNETYNRLRIGKKLSHKLNFRYSLKQGGALSPLLFSFGFVYANRNRMD